MIYMLVWTTSR